MESFLSRAAAFLFNTLVLVGIAFAVFWGTVFPVLSEWVRGVKITVGPPFFNRVNAPLGLVLLFLAGVGPAIAWRRASPRNLRRAFAGPVAAGLVAAAALAVARVPLGYAFATFALGVFVLGTVAQEFWRGMRAPGDAPRERPARARAAGREEPAALRRLPDPRRRGLDLRRHRRLERLPHRGAGDAQAGRRDGGGQVPAPLRAHHERRERAPLAPRGRGVGVARREADRDPGAREALLQEARAADDRGGDALDAQRGPLPRAGLLRSALGPGDAPGLREPARLLAVDRRRHHGRRHAGHDVAVGGRAPRGGVRAGPGAGAGRVSGAGLALVALLVAAPAVAATQQEVEESLTCQCGCGLTVHACNHLQCPSGEPMKKEIAERLARGEDRETILAG